ncbi:MAG: sodium-dependent transporter [Clostridia bacterium]|nr:sodium-dependent transporter [Clostridia bacterium]
MKNRSGFSSKLGFVMAAAGSAVGLGNIWRFPNLVANYGGGLFVLIYIILVITVGSTLMTTEIALGRRGQTDAYGCYKKLDKRFSFLGIFGILIPFFIASYYSVVGGWIVKYLVEFVRGNLTQLTGATYFSNYIASPVAPVVYHGTFIIVSMLILLCGVKQGIEKSNKIMMPALLVLSVVIAVRSVTIPGGLSGLAFYLIPDFSKFTFESVLMAIGQVFYSLSLAMGIMVTYGSYMGRDVNIQKSVKMTELFDTCVAFLAGMMIVPAVFAISGGNPDGINAGPGLLFETLPNVFSHVPFGGIFGALFFLLVLFAALTSMISLMEVVITWLIDRFQMGRIKATLLTTVSVFAFGIPSSLGFGVWQDVTIFGRSIFDFIDFTANNVIMPLVAIATCIFVGYFWGVKNIFEEAEISGSFKNKKYYTIMVRYVVPICIAAVWITGIL